MSSSTLESAAGLHEADKTRILAHMNEDHADAVLSYAHHFGGLETATAATLVSLSENEIALSVDTPEGVRAATLALPEKLHNAEDAHRVLVSMAIEARRARRPVATAPESALLAKAREAVAHLRSSTRTLMLATTSTDGTPDCSVAPFIADAQGALSIYVSELSPHTANLRANRRASVMLIEDEQAASHVLARKRISCTCEAEFLARDSAAYNEVLEALAKNIGPVIGHLRTMADFHVVRLTPAKARLVAGFGQAYDLAPLDWSRLSHVSDKGHTRSAPAVEKS